MLVDFIYSDNLVMAILNYIFFFCFFVLVVEEFQLQIKNTVSTMKYDLDVIANKCAQLELKLSEVK